MPINSKLKYTPKSVSLAEQLCNVKEQIRTTPSNVSLRVYLSQLLMVTGQWARALQQLQTAAQLEAKVIPMAQTYRELIQAEIFREEVFSGNKIPMTFGDDSGAIDLQIQSLLQRSQGNHISADGLQNKAYDQALTKPSYINNQATQWLADADSRLGPTCEVFINGGYYWLPFAKIQTLELEAPQDLRDLVWTPAKITLLDDTQKLAFLPSRYPFSYQCDNDKLALSALTEWQQLSPQAWAGTGQKTLVSEQQEYPLLTVTSVSESATSSVAV